ncbi:hypothetical protein GCM10011506_14180 [Marivirga lumbricoides]|uniref:Zinc ribbon domain-containing protein n=1 Tax=Marivirga lumbricoides TaxID=1046115 RepID=A0ABQ1LWZ8_9BACT|nr:hypothetical protein GCM10011506_14180 [Marivirga lumbricoides]
MIQCNNCKNEAGDEVMICNVCNYPIQGTVQEQAAFTARQVIQKSDVEESIGKLKNARLILYAVGAFYLIGPFTPLMSSGSSIVVGISVFLGLMFIGFGLLTYRKPVMAIGISLGLIVFYYIILLLISPIALFTGILWKMIILVILGYGFVSVRKSHRILKQNTYLASILGFGAGGEKG